MKIQTREIIGKAVSVPMYARWRMDCPKCLLSIELGMNYKETIALGNKGRGEFRCVSCGQFIPDMVKLKSDFKRRIMWHFFGD